MFVVSCLLFFYSLCTVKLVDTERDLISKTILSSI